MPLLGADPPGVIGSGDQEARSVGFAGAVFFFRHSPGMIGGGAVAGCAVGGADAVSVLRDFEGGPVEGGQGGDETGDDAGLAYAAGVSANDEDGHGKQLLALSSRLFSPIAVREIASLREDAACRVLPNIEELKAKS
jgi:hypothetical protein